MEVNRFMNVESIDTAKTTQRNVFHVAVYLLVAMCLTVFFYSQCDSGFFAIAATFIILVSAVCYLILMNYEKTPLYRRYCIAAIISGMFFVFVFPPISVPDEMYHFTASYWYASSMADESSILDSSSIAMRDEDRTFVEEFSEGNVTPADYAAVADTFSIMQTSNKTVNVEGYSFDLGSNPPQLKLPSAFAIFLARLFHLGAVPLFYLGRIFNLLFFVILASLAIRVTPVGKGIFCSVSMLPMTLHLAGSYSYDAGILGLSFLFVALLLRAIFLSEPIGRREMALLIIISVLLAPCKVIYSVAAGMVIFIPSDRFESSKHALAFKVALPFLMICSVLALRLPTMLSMASGSSGPQSHDGMTGNYYTLGALLANPIGSVLMLLKSLFAMSDFYWISAIGGSLSRFQGSVAAPHYLVAIYLVLVLVSAVPNLDDRKTLSLPERSMAIACFLLSVLGSIVAMWIGWTFESESIIQGVQGRYFLPLLPLFLLAVRPQRISADIDVPSYVLKSFLILNALYMTYILFCAFSYVG